MYAHTHTHKHTHTHTHTHTHALTHTHTHNSLTHTYILTHTHTHTHTHSHTHTHTPGDRRPPLSAATRPTRAVLAADHAAADPTSPPPDVRLPCPPPDPPGDRVRSEGAGRPEPARPGAAPRPAGEGASGELEGEVWVRVRV